MVARLLNLALVAFVFACSGNSRSTRSDEGDGSGGAAPNGGVSGSAGSAAGGTSSGGSATGGTAPITSCTESFPFSGEWRGNVLDFYFEPIDELRLSIRPDDGGYVGEVVWGSGDPPEPATDPDAPYPPGLSFEMFSVKGMRPWPGFPYTVVRGAGCESVFRVSVSSAEVFDSWCRLQEPVDSGDYGWGCVLLTSAFSSDGSTCTALDSSGEPLAEYPQWRCDLCGGGASASICECDSSSCRYNAEATHTFDLTLSDGGNVLSGRDATCGDCTVRLERVE
jgi:hypothetical protein